MILKLKLRQTSLISSPSRKSSKFTSFLDFLLAWLDQIEYQLRSQIKKY